MSTFPIHNAETAPTAAKPLLEQTQEAFGFVPNLVGIMASSPAITEAYLSVASTFANSGFDATEQQVVLLTVSHFHECTYCMAAHSVISKMTNVPDEMVMAIRDDQPIADAKLEALRQFTALMLERRGALRDAEVQTFLTAGYEASHVMDVIVGIAQKTMSNYTNHLAQTPLDDAFSAMAWQPK